MPPLLHLLLHYLSSYTVFPFLPISQKCMQSLHMMGQIKYLVPPCGSRRMWKVLKEEEERIIIQGHCVGSGPKLVMQGSGKEGELDWEVEIGNRENADTKSAHQKPEMWVHSHACIWYIQNLNSWKKRCFRFLSWCLFSKPNMNSPRNTISFHPHRLLPWDPQTSVSATR